jgi:hypothetical protein
MEVATEVNLETPRRSDVGSELLLGFLVQPLRRMVRHEQAEVVLLKPICVSLAAKRSQLYWVEGELALVLVTG